MLSARAAGLGGSVHVCLIFLPGPKGEPRNVGDTLKAEVEGHQPHFCMSGLGKSPRHPAPVLLTKAHDRAQG